MTVRGEQGAMRPGEGDAIGINGGRPEGNNLTLDGLTNNNGAISNGVGSSTGGLIPG